LAANVYLWPATGCIRNFSYVSWLPQAALARLEDVGGSVVIKRRRNVELSALAAFVIQ